MSAKITKAYCVELGRIVDIIEVRNEYFAQAYRVDFNFKCSDPKCIQSDGSRTVMLGISYKVIVDDSVNFQRT